MSLLLETLNLGCQGLAKYLIQSGAPQTILLKKKKKADIQCSLCARQGAACFMNIN